MKKLVLFLSIFGFTTGYSQVYGDVFIDKRAIKDSISFTIPYSVEGKLVFDIRVNVDGKVTYCALDESKSTITSTPAMIKGRNQIIKGLTFVKGIGYPKFHRGFVQINTVQDSTETQNQFLPPPF